MIHIYLKREKIMTIVNIGLETHIKAISRYHGCATIEVTIIELNISGNSIML